MTEKELASIELRDFKTEQPFTLEKGIVYQGSFKIDDSGTIVVRPYQQGTKPNNLRKVVDDDCHAIYLSKKLVRVVVSIQKGTREEVLNRFKQIILDCYKNLAELPL